MWYFRGQEGICVYILPNCKKSFGKLSSDVKLAGDATISRLHAIVSVESTGELDIQYKCVINDLSKYGTFVTRDGKKIKLPKNEKFFLEAGDIVQFGLKETTFVVLHYSFVTVRSSLNEEELNRLKNIIDYIGGQLLETWKNSCTHLTVTKSILFTTKIASALASAKPIVTMAYWEAVNVAIRESKDLPETETFLPMVKEDWLKVSSKLFLPNEKRRTLFKGLSFVHFCIKQYHIYAPLITAAGGKSCVYPTKRPLTPRDLTAKNAIVIQQPVSDSTLLTQDIAADYQIIYHKLQAVKRRLVSDTEIPLAILYCTTETYCNPKFDFARFLKSKSQQFSPSDVMLIDDTQYIGNVENRKRTIIPETCESEIGEVILKKAHFSNENEQKNNSNVSESTVENMQNVYVKGINCKIIPETSDFRNSESISKKAYSSKESEQRNIFASNVASKTQNDENISKNIQFSNLQRNISGSSNSDFRYNIFTKQSQIIPESCYSSEKHVTNYSPNKNNQKQALTISETYRFNERHTTYNFATEKEQNILQEKESFEKNNLSFAKNDQQKKDKLQDNKLKSQPKIIIKDNSLTSEKSNLNCEKNNTTTIEEDKVSDRHESTDWENCKNLQKPRIISIQETDSIGICIQRSNKKNMSEKSCEVEKSQDLSKEQNLNSERNQEDRTATENKMQETHVKNKESLKKGDNRYNKYFDQKFMDEILRKDIPCGKRFTKTSIIIPKTILRLDDFII